VDFRVFRLRDLADVGSVWEAVKPQGQLPKPSAGTPWQLLGVYCPHEQGICCNNRITLAPGTSNGPVRPFRPWLSPAIPPQRPTAASAGGGSALSMPRMRLGTSASSSRARKGAKVSFRLRDQALVTYYLCQRSWWNGCSAMAPSDDEGTWLQFGLVFPESSHRFPHQRETKFGFAPHTEWQAVAQA
jgi:hypothetical protein